MQQKYPQGGWVRQDQMGLLQFGQLQHQRGDRVVNGNSQNGEGEEMVENLGWEMVAQGRNL